MPKIIQERMAGLIEGDFVLFLLGMRINRLWKVHKWFPVLWAMSRMLRQLTERPDSGLLGSRLFRNGLRNILAVQYWRSFEHLERFARDPGKAHLPALVAFTKRVGSSGDVGIWHETYRVKAGQYEAIYGNMPAYGLGAAGQLVPAVGKYATAASRLGLKELDHAPVDDAGVLQR